jgi:hypothetical protein
MPLFLLMPFFYIYLEIELQIKYNAPKLPTINHASRKKAAYQLKPERINTGNFKANFDSLENQLIIRKTPHPQIVAINPTPINGKRFISIFTEMNIANRIETKPITAKAKECHLYCKPCFDSFLNTLGVGIYFFISRDNVRVRDAQPVACHHAKKSICRLKNN